MSKHQHPAIRVVAKSDSFRRAGHEFGKEAKTIPLGSLHKDELEAINNDPQLVVVGTVVHLEAEQAKALPHAEAAHVVSATKAIELHGVLSHAVESEARDILAEAQAEALKLAAEADRLDALKASLDAREKDLADRIAKADERHAALDEQSKKLSDREAALAQAAPQHVTPQKPAAHSKAGR